MSGDLDLRLCFSLELLDSPSRKIAPSARAGGPGKLLLEKRKQRLHPASDCLLLRQQFSAWTLQQPIRESHFTGGKDIARRFISEETDAKTLSPVPVQSRDARTSIRQEARDVFNRHPFHVADIEIHQSFDTNVLIEQIEGG